jgi:general secretion pathway protein L
MAENLFLRLSETEAEGKLQPHLEWMLLDETSGIVRFRGEGTVAEFQDLNRDLTFSGKTIAMIPGEDVLLTEAVVPSKQQRQILQAVPFMVEEHLATDVEACHFAIGQRNDTGAVAVAVIDQTRMRFWYDILLELGLKPSFMTTDLLAVKLSTSCHIIVDGERALIRSGSAEGVCVSTEMLAMTVGLFDEQLKADVQVSVRPSQLESISLQINQMNAELTAPVEVTEPEYSVFETISRGFDQSTINLLQGAFKVQERSIKQGSAWRSVAVLTVCAFVLHLLVLMGQAVYLDVQARQMDAEARQMYASIYPNDRNVRDMRRRWQNHLRKGGGMTGEFMTLFVETTQNIPGTNLVLSNLNYNQSRGDMMLQLEANRSEQLISFADTLNKLGLEAEIGTINQADDAVRGSVKVKMLGGS